MKKNTVEIPLCIEPEQYGVYIIGENGEITGKGTFKNGKVFDIIPLEKEKESGVVYTPWTESQVKMLKEWQDDPKNHPYTCDCGESLIPSVQGWHCDCCNYKQKWCFFSHVNIPK